MRRSEGSLYVNKCGQTFGYQNFFLSRAALLVSRVAVQLTWLGSVLMDGSPWATHEQSNRFAKVWLLRTCQPYQYIPPSQIKQRVLQFFSLLCLFPSTFLFFSINVNKSERLFCRWPWNVWRKNFECFTIVGMVSRKRLWASLHHLAFESSAYIFSITFLLKNAAFPWCYILSHYRWGDYKVKVR
jgi:hypothetical protein